jgi:hypothetical protein
MSLYKPKDTSVYHYDFRHGGHRFCGSTKTVNRRQAEPVERQAKRRRQAIRPATSCRLVISRSMMSAIGPGKRSASTIPPPAT